MGKAITYALDKVTSLGALGKEATIRTCHVQNQVGPSQIPLLHILRFRFIFTIHNLSTLTHVTYPLLHFVW